MHAVFLDFASLGSEDLDTQGLTQCFDSLELYDATAPEQVIERMQSAQVMLVNKVKITPEHFAALPNLKLILVSATGTDNVDKAAAQAHSVVVCNVTAYGTPSVAQHTLMLMLNLATRFESYRTQVQQGAWSQSERFCLMDFQAMELHGKTLGLIGAGELGQAVGKLAEAFGMRVLVWDRAGTGAPRLSLEQLLPQVDFLSIHCLLTPQTKDLIGAPELALMPKGSYVINTARGGIVNEAALLEALDSGHLAGAGFDVLTQEPPPPSHPMLVPRPNLIVTPHTAWLAREARQRMVDEIIKNAEAFKLGQPRNVVT
ncbi:MAG: D-2-hydroxyacid dehydrogenase [Litorivicinus sp.]